ncbi:MAG: glycosyltransferase family 4 protein [Chloroflexi bacterium]|nr:glycosyltransferase family 4 protein [Chloroflexota bacterium]
MTINQIALVGETEFKTAFDYYRYISPCNYAGIRVVNALSGSYLDFEKLKRSQIILVTRDEPKRFCRFQILLAFSRLHGIPVILDMDDEILNLPKSHPDFISGFYADSLPAILAAMYSVDAITVTNEHLRNYASRYNDNVVILPNYLDPAIWPLSSKADREIGHTEDAEKKITIVYSGSNTHSPDLNEIAESIISILNEFKEQVIFKSIGVPLPKSMTDVKGISYISHLSYDFREYSRLLREESADIAVAPLNNNNFNMSKSPVKYFEYSSAGWPVIASDWGPYKEVIKHGFNGLLASDKAGWMACLHELIMSKEKRDNLNHNAVQTIDNFYNISKHSREWLSAYESIVRSGIRRKPKVSLQILEEIKNIAIALEAKDRFKQVHEQSDGLDE